MLFNLSPNHKALIISDSVEVIKTVIQITSTVKRLRLLYITLTA